MRRLALASSAALAALAAASLREAGFDVVATDGPRFTDRAADELRRRASRSSRSQPPIQSSRSERGAQWKRERQGRRQR